MKVVFLIGYNRLPRNSKLGDNMLRFLAQRNDTELHVLSLGNEDQTFEIDALHVHLVKKPHPMLIPILIPRIINGYRNKIDEIHPDIVHAYGSYMPNSTLATFVKGYPRVLSVVGIKKKEMRYDHGNCFSNWRNALNEKYVISKIENIIIESSSNRDILQKMTKSNMYIVHGGVDITSIEGIQPGPEEFDTDAFYVGGLDLLKGPDILIKAIPKVINEIPGFKLVIAGRGNLEDELKALIHYLDLESHIRLTGYISDEDKLRYYKGARFAVVPSRWDFSPMTIYEAMACGTPVIGSTMTNSGILDNGNTGLLFESENFDDLADKIIYMIRNEEHRKEMARNAYETAQQHDWSIITEKIMNVYRNVIEDFNRSRDK